MFHVKHLKKILAFFTLTRPYRSVFPDTSIGYRVGVWSRGPEYLHWAAREIAPKEYLNKNLPLLAFRRFLRLFYLCILSNEEFHVPKPYEVLI